MIFRERFDFNAEAAVNTIWYRGKAEELAEFFKVNERKLNALIEATTNDMQKAETAVLRLANDQYRKIIYNAQVYANTGAGTYEKAVDMATKDFLSAGINCIVYKNGRRVNIKSYAEMALRTANKRAYLQGEGEKRQEWGVATVILNKRSNPCPLCAPFVGKVFIDDVWSGGSKDGISNVTGVKYPLLSEAIHNGLYHPNCRDSHTTYFEGISTPPDGSEYTADELDALAENYKTGQKANQAERMERLGKYSLDKDNKRAYTARAKQWRKKAGELEKSVAKSAESGIIKQNKGETADIDMIEVGRIDIEKYKCVSQDIVTDEVIITNERIQHIKERHPNDFELYCTRLKEVVENPEYIIEANKPNTALILKSFSIGAEQFKTILRLVTSTDDESFKNSIITFMRINKQEWNRLLRNKKILYKSE